MKTVLTAACAAGLTALAALATPAFADTIDFSQFGPEGSTPTTPLSGFTADGVHFELVGPSDFYRGDQGSTIAGQFVTGTPVLLTSGPGQMVLYFDTPISSLADIFVESNAYGDYTATMTAYGTSGLLGSVSYSSTSAYAPGTLPGFSIYGSGITTITLSSTNDSLGIDAAGPYTPVTPAPEPASWALMLVGFGALGAALRTRRRGAGALTA